MKIVTILTLILLTGCAGVGLVSTSDPDVKIQQSYQMMNQGRNLMAKDLIQQAITIYKENKNILGLAESYSALGSLYKQPIKKGGNADYPKSGRYFEKAKNYFEEANSEIGAIKSLVGIGNSYHLQKNDTTACQYYDEALSRYTAGKTNSTITVEPEIFDKRYKNFGDVINAYVLREKCST